MAEENDTATVEQGNTTEETGTEETTETRKSDDLSELKTLLESQNEKIEALEGRLARTSKKAKKEEKSETPKKTDEASDRLQERIDNLALRTAEITNEDDVQLARDTAEKWGMDIEALVTDEDFQAKLKRQQDSRQNAEAASNVKGDKGSKSSAKQTAAYWVNKGEVPTAEQADRKLRAQVIREFTKNNRTSGKTFYND